MIQLEGVVFRRAQGDIEPVFDGRHIHTHQHGERLRRHVVRPFRRAAWKLQQVGIVLHFEQRLGPVPEYG